VVNVALLVSITVVVSHQHMHMLVLTHGGLLIPLSAEGMGVAASMSSLMTNRLGQRGDRLPWMLLTVGSLVSLAANVLVAELSWVGR
jgi:hypothetical protein